MACITLIKNAKKPTYKIRVCYGYDAQEKKQVKNFTFHPDPSLTKKQQEKEVQRYADNLERKVKEGESFDGDKMSFEEFSYKWLESRKGDLVHTTYCHYRSSIEKIIVPYFHQYKLTKIRLPMVEEFFRSLAGEYSLESLKRFKIAYVGGVGHPCRLRLDTRVAETGQPRR